MSREEAVRKMDDFVRWVLTLASAAMVGALLAIGASSCGVPYSLGDRLGAVGSVLVFTAAGYEWGKRKAKPVASKTDDESLQ